MENESKKPVMTASCPKCGQTVRFYVPDTAGVLKITCPNAACGTVLGVKVTDQQIKMGMGDAAGSPRQGSQPQETSASNAPTDAIMTGGKGSADIRLAWLVQKGRHFFSKDRQYRLKTGPNTIGMLDPDAPSDIMIEGDKTISHKSVTITVEGNGGCHKYLLTVNRAKNPVYLKGKAIAVGTSIYIEPETDFVLGSTHFLITDK